MASKIKSDSPQVAMLLQETEKQYGMPVKTQSDFELLAARIEAKTREHISDSTVKRLWIRSLAYDTVSLRTLNVLSKYSGYKHYNDFLESLKDKGLPESELIADKNAVKAADLEVGDIVQIAWMPDRECTLEYLGDRKFIARECLNSKLHPGDTFFCSAFIKGRKLYVENLTQESEVYEIYGMGTEHGLTRVELLKK